MFNLSSKTEVDKKFKLTELYKLIGADKDIKASAGNIVSITLKNVLSKSTMNYHDDGNVKEIYIFDIELSTKVIPTLFISALDKSIILNTAFVFRCNNEHLLYGALKQKNEKGLKFSKYYQTEWTSSEELIDLPIDANNLDAIYKAIIDILIPIDAREDENTADFVSRYELIKKTQTEIDKVQKQVDNEVQPKKRFLYNARLKELQKQMEELKGE